MTFLKSDYDTEIYLTQTMESTTGCSLQENFTSKPPQENLIQRSPNKSNQKQGIYSVNLQEQRLMWKSA